MGSELMEKYSLAGSVVRTEGSVVRGRIPKFQISGSSQDQRILSLALFPLHSSLFLFTVVEYYFKIYYIRLCCGIFV